VGSDATGARKSRERELVKATRKLFDQRGGLDAPVEEIANEVGIPRGLIYRVFSSKEELYVLTVTDYLAELGELLETATAAPGSAEEKLVRITESYAGFCLRYPAFLDASLALMHGPARELNHKVSESVWLRLGQEWAAASGRSRGRSARAARTARSPSGIPTTRPTFCGPRHSAQCTSPASRWACGRPLRASRNTSV